MAKPLESGYKPWLIASLAVLVASLVLLAVTVTAWFVLFGSTEYPLWLTILGVVAVLGIGLGFGGMVLLFAIAAVKSLRDERRVGESAGEPSNPSDALRDDTNSRPIPTPPQPVE